MALGALKLHQGAQVCSKDSVREERNMVALMGGLEIFGYPAQNLKGVK